MKEKVEQEHLKLKKETKLIKQKFEKFQREANETIDNAKQQISELRATLTHTSISFSKSIKIKFIFTDQLQFFWQF